MKTIRRYFMLYRQYLKNHLIGIMEYKADFFLGIISMLFEQALGIISIMVIFNNILDIQGWSFGEILFIFAVATLGRSVHLIFFDNLWAFSQKYIRNGQFDRVLCRPVNPLFQIIAERLNFVSIGQLAIGITCLVYSSSWLGLTWTALKVFMMFIMILSSGFIFVGIHLFFMSISFWMVNSDPIVWGVFNLTGFTQYPMSIYPKVISIFLTAVIPYAFTSFIPASFFFFGDKYLWYSLLTPAVSALVFIAAYVFWRVGIRHYTSTGN